MITTHDIYYNGQLISSEEIEIPDMDPILTPEEMFAKAKAELSEALNNKIEEKLSPTSINTNAEIKQAIRETFSEVMEEFKIQ